MSIAERAFLLRDSIWLEAFYLLENYVPCDSVVEVEPAVAHTPETRPLCWVLFVSTQSSIPLPLRSRWIGCTLAREGYDTVHRLAAATRWIGQMRIQMASTICHRSVFRGASQMVIELRRPSYFIPLSKLRVHIKEKIQGVAWKLISNFPILLKTLVI